ncbi:hypothetical protein L6164_005576 [Bauhinia variegata]|uniref:Uncharacterized protein n=1 Tax=Bauhinia variegata TaxID=167791 RepID=A0ACB9PTV8_BAUVA|nr:hypothetical protein L6164_005576 [Bauhinia variegata]
MEEPKEETSVCSISESSGCVNEKVVGETLEESEGCPREGQDQIKGCFSGEQVTEEDGSGCNGKDVMVEVADSDLYIDGVCTRQCVAELNDEACDGSVEVKVGLDKHEKPLGSVTRVANGAEAGFESTQVVHSSEDKSKNAINVLDCPIEDRNEVLTGTTEDHNAEELREVVGSDEIELLNAQEEVGTRVADPPAVVYTKPRETEVPDDEDVGVKRMEEEAGLPDDKVVTTRSGDTFGVLSESISIGEENSETRLVEEDQKKLPDLADHGAMEVDNNVTSKSFERQEKIANSGTDMETSAVEEKSSPEQISLPEGQDMEIEDQPERILTLSQSAFIPGTSVSCSTGEQNLEANAFSGVVGNGTQIADRVHYAPVGAEGSSKSNDDTPFSADNQKSKLMKCSNQSVVSDPALVESNMKHNIEGQASTSEQGGSHGQQEYEVEELNDDEPRKTDDKVMKHAEMKPGSSGRLCYAGYELPPEKEGDFSVFDMVWGKVRSHPWWPGQIFDPSYSSEKAMKHYKKDCFLVAYFGDRTFAWNEASQLKPFRTHFTNIEKHSNSESFQNAVDCALDEVSRRVEFGLACSCTPKDIYDKIKFQTVENTGIRQGLSLRNGLDESLSVNYFSPDRLLEYLKSLSKFPSGGIDRLELAITRAQLLAFYRLKGYPFLPEFQYCGGLDNDMDTFLNDDDMDLSQDESPVRKDGDQASAGPGILKSQNNSRHKRKHNLKDGMYPKKEKSLSKLMGWAPDSPDDDYWSDEKAIDNLDSPMLSKKRRTSDNTADDSANKDGRKTISVAKVSNSLPKPSFKFGERIRRVASQLTGSPITLKSPSEKSQKPDGSIDEFAVEGSGGTSFQNLEETESSGLIVQPKYSSLDDLLSSLQWMAQNPLADYSSSRVILSFFSDFRNSISVASSIEIFPTNKVGNKRKKLPVAGSPETFEFEDMSDTYWTDRVIQNGSEEQPSRRNRKRDNQLVPAEPDKTVKASRRSHARKRFSDENHVDEAPDNPPASIDEKAPAELVMNFAELDSVPSETSLNKMFRRFGPLKESETEVDRMSSRARVVFKKSADAEVAFSSAKKFNIFGPVLVNYQLNYTPSALFKASSIAPQDQEMHLDLSNFDVNMV